MYETFVVSVPQKYLNTITEKTEIPLCRYIDTENTIQTIRLHTENVNMIENISITVKKNKPTPILFYTEQLDSEPQGYLYPYFSESSEMGGFTAFVAYCLYNQSYGTNNEITSFIEHFNWTRFQETTSLNVSNSILESIWSLNIENILTKIANGTLNANDLK